MVRARSISRLKRLDWDFAGLQSESPFSAIHWYPCRFVSQIPAAIIGTLSEPGDTVLDPFVGSGTTVVEAQRLGRASIGIDINPVAALAASSKTFTAQGRTVERWVAAIEDDVRDLLQGSLLSEPKFLRDIEVPGSVQQTKWYTKKVFRELRAVWGIVQAERGQKAVLAKAAFSSILLKVCRETRHWGYVCDNTTPKSDHEGDVLGEYTSALRRYKVAYQERDREFAELFEGVDIPEAKVFCADARAKLREIPIGSVDLVVTSPPYFGVSDYVKAQRLSMEWFGDEIEPFRQKEIGARSKRHRRASMDEYLDEISEVFSGVRDCLRRGSACVVVVGESSARGPYISKFVERVLRCGFELVHTADRRVSAQRRLNPSILHEQVLVLS